MPGVARAGDIAFGTCFGHAAPIPVTGIVSVSSQDVLNGTGVARVGDMVIFNCGHNGTIISGCATVLTNSKPTAKVGSMVVGPMIASIIQGSNNCMVP